MDCQILATTKKRCSSCKKRRNVSFFKPRKSSKDGLRGQCTRCIRSYNSAYFYKNRCKHRPVGDRVAYMKRLHAEHRDFLVTVKAVPCADCHGACAACCMEFDHVRGAKKHNIAEMSSWARSTVIAEIAKCEIVCANCHRLRTERRRAVRAMNKPLAKFRLFVSSLKAAPCADCSTCFEATAMDFDHVRGLKVASISNMWAFPRVKLLEEVAKCDLVCVNCHRLRTQARLQKAA